jgi:hypothetical protein
MVLSVITRAMFSSCMNETPQCQANVGPTVVMVFVVRLTYRNLPEPCCSSIKQYAFSVPYAMDTAPCKDALNPVPSVVCAVPLPTMVTTV